MKLKNFTFTGRRRFPQFAAVSQGNFVTDHTLSDILYFRITLTDCFDNLFFPFTVPFAMFLFS